MRVFGLIGYPLGHSFSKQYFTEKFEREKIRDCIFESFAIPSIDEFPYLLQSNPDLKAVCVTIPYKEQVLRFVDKLSPEVESIGATNSIKIENGVLTAYNTDIVGFEKSFMELRQPHHTKALVLGTGGAAKAVMYVLDKLEIGYLLVSRTPSANKGNITYNDIDDVIVNTHPIIINCSPVGMYPNENAAPAIPYDKITTSNYLYDLVYKPAKTIFLQEGEKRGAVVKNGYDMLLLQAEESWRIWNEE